MITPSVRRHFARVVARRLVRQAAYGAIAAIGAGYRLLVRRRVQRDQGTVERILVIRLDLLGDVLFSMPAVEALRESYPHARLTMLTLPYTAPLARLYSCVDEVVAVDTNRIRTVGGLLDPRTWLEYRSTYLYLRRQRFDLAVSVCGRMASLCAFLSGARRTVGYTREAYPFLLTDLVPGGRYLQRVHEVEYALRLAREAAPGAALARIHRSPGAGAEATKETRPERLRVPIPPAARQRVDRLLEERGIGRADRLVVIHAGSVNGSAKRWPAGSWSRFADEVTEELNVRVVLAGATADESIAREVVAGAAAPLVSLAGQTSVEDLVALLARADLVASGDSGPLHLATALGRPLVAIYGPTDVRVYGPYCTDVRTHVHRHDLPCSPCYTMAASAECPLGDPICMRLVTVRQVVDSAVRLLS